MAWQGIGSNCLTCARPMGHSSLSVQNEENPSIEDALKKHFWFTEGEFQGATICHICWNQVNHFHQFYTLVEEVYHMRLVKSESVDQRAGLQEYRLETSGQELDVDMQRHESFISVKEEPALEIFDEIGSDTERPMDENEDLSGNQYFQRDFLDEPVQVDSKPKSFSSGYGLDRPMETLHETKDETMFKCNQCPRSFAKQSERVSHMKCHRMRYHCSECPSKFRNGNPLIAHVVKTHPGTSPFRCPFCQRIFNSYRELHKHERSVHPGEWQKTRTSSVQAAAATIQNCSEQNKPELSKSVEKPQNEDDFLAQHVKFICKQCGEQTPSFTLYVEHCSFAHGHKHPSIECCGEQFATKASLYQHVQVVSNFRCKLCSMAFSVKYDLDCHMNDVHVTDAETFKCNRCSMLFDNRRMYRQHLHSHRQNSEDDDKPRYACADCPNIFWYGSQLREHIADDHPGVTPYRCPFCNKTFSKSYSLVRHVDALHPDEMLEKQERRSHMENQHPTPPFTEDSSDLSVHLGSSPYERTVNLETDPNGNSPRYLLEPISSLLSHPEKLEEPPTTSQPVLLQDECSKESQPEISENGRTDRKLKHKKMEDLIREHVKFICKQCGKQSSNFKKFVQHSSVEHGNEHPSVDCCGKKFVRKFYLYQHVQFLNNADIFRCKICSKNFYYKFGLKRHMLSVHATKEDLKYKCARCPRSFGMISIYRMHIKKHLARRGNDPKLRYPCADCPNVLSSAKSLKDHVTAIHPGITPYKCPLCKRTFIIGRNMAKHVRTMHPIERKREIKRSIEKNRHLRYPCTECSSEFNIGRLLTDHVLNVHPGRSPFKCPFCKRTFNNYIELHKHERAVHPDEWQRILLSSQKPREETTDNCLKVSDTEMTENQPEMSDNEQEMSESEQYCTTKEKYQQEEDDYIAKHTQLSCRKCGEKSPNFAMLLKHASNVHGKKKVTVECCGKKFDSKSRLYEHVQLVNNPNIFRCTICFKVHTMKYRLRQHMKDAHGTKEEKKFKCDQCPRTFAILSMFTQHCKTHQVREQQQMFLCADCPKMFKHGCELKKHLATVHPEVIPFKCAFCKRTFSRNSNMVRHVEALHPNELQEKLKRSPPSPAVRDDECLEESRPESSGCNVASQQQEILALVKEQHAFDESEREETHHIPS